MVSTHHDVDFMTYSLIQAALWTLLTNRLGPLFSKLRGRTVQSFSVTFPYTPVLTMVKGEGCCLVYIYK